MTFIDLPDRVGGTEHRVLQPPTAWSLPAAPIRSRTVFAAAHVSADPRSDNTPGAPAQLDWESTLAFRDHLWSYGFGVAEAMDTAQRGMGLGWQTTRELISRSAALAAERGGAICAGAGTDHLTGAASGLSAVVEAYEEQLEVVEQAGAIPVLMASRHLAAVATHGDDYEKVYSQLLAQVRRPVILHWLGPMFDDSLSGYWGTTDIAAATDTVLRIINEHAEVVDGIKVSLLDAQHERSLRARLPAGVRCYTGDDFNYAELIDDDGAGHSDALLGAFAVIAPAASNALQRLDAADREGFRAVLDSTQTLSRHVFAEPTRFYKVGVAFAAWLAGYQPAVTMVGGLQGARSMMHLVDEFRMLDELGLLPDPDLAAHRMRAFLVTQGAG